MSDESFTPRDWFWIVGNDETRAWSSAASAYVSEWPHDRLTRIRDEDDLTDVLRQYGLPGPAPTQADYAAAIQARIDFVAAARGYHDGVHAASYVVSTHPTWAVEATAFVAWRDTVWVYAYAELAKVQNGERPQPTVAQLVSELPEIQWPT